VQYLRPALAVAQPIRAARVTSPRDWTAFDAAMERPIEHRQNIVEIAEPAR